MKRQTASTTTADCAVQTAVDRRLQPNPHAAPGAGRPRPDRPDADLPEGWAWVPVSDVVEQVHNVNPSDQPEKEFGYVDISSIDNRDFTISDAKRFKGKDAPSRARRPIRTGDVLFANVRTYLRNVAMVGFGTSADVCSTGFTVLRPTPSVEPRYLFRYVLTDGFVDALTPQQTGTHYPATSDRVVMSEAIPLPPLAEQKRIVAKVEDLLARVNAARERLAKVPAILKRFRQSVLAAACSGRLTEEWREANPTPKIEHRELSERPCDSESVDIPDTWRLVNIECVLSRTRRGMKTGPFGSALKKAEHLKEGIPVLGIENIRNGQFAVGSKIHISPTKALELAEYDAIGGDIIISRSGTVGDACVVPDALGESRISTNIIRLTLDRAQVDPILFAHLLNGSPFVLDQVHALCGGSTRDFLNQTILRRVKFPLPPLPEQHEIVRRVAGLFALADSIEKQAAAGTARVEKLTQAILAKAFRGELVPTEAGLARREGRDHEPAAALLERIRNGRDVPSRYQPKRRTLSTQHRETRTDSKEAIR